MNNHIIEEMNNSTSTHTRQSHVLIRIMTKDDIPKIVELQKIAFPLMAAEGVYWRPNQLESHLHIFPQGQFVAEWHGKIVGSCSSLIIQLKSDYDEHTWMQKKAVTK